jgi:hypothetical protein
LKEKNTINLDWRMKLKTNKTFSKVQRKKIRNQNNKDWNLNTNNKKDQTVIF